MRAPKFVSCELRNSPTLFFLSGPSLLINEASETTQGSRFACSAQADVHIKDNTSQCCLTHQPSGAPARLHLWHPLSGHILIHSGEDAPSTTLSHALASNHQISVSWCPYLSVSRNQHPHFSAVPESSTRLSTAHPALCPKKSACTDCRNWLPYPLACTPWSM